MKKILFISMLLYFGSLSANDIVSKQFNKHLDKITKDFYNKSEENRNQEKTSIQTKINMLINDTQEYKRPKFINKKSLELDIYVRENVKVIDRKYVKKTADGWERIKVLDTNYYE